MSRILNYRHANINRQVLHTNKVNNVLSSIADGSYKFDTTTGTGFTGFTGERGYTGMIGPTGPNGTSSSSSSNSLTLSTLNEWTNRNTFNAFLPTTNLIPLLDTELTNKLYVDDSLSTFRRYIFTDFAEFYLNADKESDNIFNGKNTFNNDVNITHQLLLNVWKYSPSTSDGIISSNVPATILIDNDSIATTLILPTATQGVITSLIKVKNSTGIVTLNYGGGIYVFGSSIPKITMTLGSSSKFIFYDVNWYQI